ncbi:MAG: class I SAM-dependent methyltransferase [Pyrinomonadaceae bacterium]
MISQNLKKSVSSFHQKDIALMEKYLGETPFSPSFWIRKRVRDAIIANSHVAHGTLVDVGCGLKQYEIYLRPFVDSYYGTEFSPESGFNGNCADVAGNAAAMPFADESIDTIICTEVLEHVSDPERAISEFARVMRPDGVIITTAPFFFPIHDKFDFYRYSDKGLAEMMQRHGLIIERIEPLSGTGMTLALLINIYWFDIGFLWTKWLYPIGLALRPLLLLVVSIINILGWIADRVLRSNHMSFDHLTIARKPKDAKSVGMLVA